MATDKNEPDEAMVAARKDMWNQFIRFSTYTIVGIAVILILMALFLL
jgi:hypothetical protein